MSVFPTKILLATDGSDSSALAIQTAIEIANMSSSELHVVHVDPGSYPGTVEAGPIPEEYQEEMVWAAQRLLDTEVEKVKKAGGEVANAHFRTGRADREIVQLGEEIGAGLIVMGSRGLGGIRRLALGSVSESVVRHAHCPVLVTRR